MAALLESGVQGSACGVFSTSVHSDVRPARIVLQSYASSGGFGAQRWMKHSPVRDAARQRS